MHQRAKAYAELMASRRSVRFFSDRPVPQELIGEAIRAAGSAPSGAHRQPWRFVAVSDPDLKRAIREAAEKEEHASYHGRMPDEWLKALEPFGTDWRKPFLETAPWIVVCFAELHGVNAEGTKRKNYYVQESCGIACGLFISAIHYMGLVTLTHTPSPWDSCARYWSAKERASLHALPSGLPRRGGYRARHPSVGTGRYCRLAHAALRGLADEEDFGVGRNGPEVRRHELLQAVTRVPDGFHRGYDAILAVECGRQCIVAMVAHRGAELVQAFTKSGDLCINGLLRIADASILAATIDGL